MWTRVLAVAVPLLAIVSYLGDINDSKTELIWDTQKAELQCRAARDQIKLKLRDFSESGNPTARRDSEIQALANQMARFTDYIGSHIGRRAYLLNEPRGGPAF